MIELKHVRKQFPEATPLQDVNAVINQGDIISVIGPSGTGKSTLLRCINMLDPPTSGEIIADGQVITAPGCDLKAVRRELGMVFQSFNLFGHLTVIENLMLPQTDILKRSRQEAYDKSVQLLKRVGMAGRLMQYPDQLSGGQKQRVAIARTLTMDPKVILFDEPTSALDTTMVGEVESVIQDLADTGTTMMIVTHEMRFARKICNRVFYMDQGGIYEDGTPEQVFDAPLRDRTRRFIKHLKTLELLIDSFNYDFQENACIIENYAYKSGMSKADCLSVRLAFEELCQQLLLPNIRKTESAPKIKITFDYDPAADTMEEEVCYNGSEFNPEDSSNELALTMLHHTTYDLTHEPMCADGFTNRLRLKVKTGKR